MSSPTVTNSSSALNSKTLLLAETSAQVSGGLIPSADGVQVGYMLHKKFTLTDAQIKALPTTPVLILAAPGANKRIAPVKCTVFLSNSPSGGYTNIDLDAAYLQIRTNAGQWIISGIANDSTTSPKLANFTEFFNGTAKDHLIDLLPTNMSAYEWNVYGPTPIWVTPDINNDQGDQINQAIYIDIFNNGTGNLTGGGSSNKLIGHFYYVIEDYS